MPKVSVLIPVYNAEPYIGKTIESVLNQTYTDFELVIVDDCSTDGTFQICENYAKQDDRIRLYRNERNLGMMPNWNHGITLCDGEYWGKLDADDLWEPEFLHDCVDVLEADEKVGLVCSGFDEINEKGDLLSSTMDNDTCGIIKLSNYVKAGPKSIFSHPYVRQGIGLLRFEIFKELGPFTLHDAGDTEMWYRIAAHHDLYYFNKVMHHHRIWPKNFTRTQVISEGKSEQNLYEVRNLIFRYYQKGQIISNKMAERHLSRNLFEYQKFLSYQKRTQHEYFDMIKIMIKMLRKWPGAFLKFYFSRLGFMK